METKIINIFANEDNYSQETRRLLRRKLQQSGYTIPSEFSEDAELIISIGGDGAFLKTLHVYDFPQIPFLGINTGHLGFFEELHPNDLDDFIFWYSQKNYVTQNLKTISAVVTTESESFEYKGLNEMLLRGEGSRSIHLNISIGESFIERFSGDGILVSTPAGSTAYNYSLGGSIIDPRLSILQITPIAPMNTTAYRSFTSSVVLPKELSVRIHPEYLKETGLMVVMDGMEHHHVDIKEVKVGFSETIVRLIRFANYDFWNKVKTKFL